MSALLWMPFSALAINSVLTGNAASITENSVILSGSANPEGFPSSGYFRYATLDIPPVFCNDVFGSDMKYTKETNIGSGGTTSFSKKITGLEPNTKYYYCAIASSRTEIRYGNVKEFVTTPCASCFATSVITEDALVVDADSSYVNGSYNSTSVSTTWFEYRKINPVTETAGGLLIDISEPWKKTSIVSHSSGAGDMVSLINSLTSGTQYEFRAAAASGGTTYYGGVLSFTTASPGNTNPGGTPGGQPYQAPCGDDDDENCNGTGGGGTYVGGGIGGGGDTPVNNDGGGVNDGGGGGVNNNGGGNTTSGGNGNNQNNGNNGNNGSNGNLNPNGPFVLGQNVIPPIDAVVRYHEGIETVFQRQIAGNEALARAYGWDGRQDLQTFAWTLAHFYARSFGYINTAGREIRVSEPDVAAYQLAFLNGRLTVYEYYYSRIISIQTMTSTTRNAYGYEYYFTKR